MNRDADSKTLITGDMGDDSVAVALSSEQLRTHLSNLPWALAGSATAAVFFVAMMWTVVPRVALMTWAGALAVVIALRLLTGYFHRRATASTASDRAWLLRYRLGYLVPGVLWGLACVLPMNDADAAHRALAIIVLASLTATTFTMSAFDLAAALCFGVPALGILSVQLLGQPETVFRLLGLAEIASLVFLSLTARRANRVIRNYVTLRLTESRQAEALRASEELLDRTGATAKVGGWELDLATMALRLTAQAYRIHDVPMTSRPTFEGFVSLYGPEQQAVIRAGLDAVIAHGTPYDEVLPLTTVRGRRRWVHLIGHPQFDGYTVVRISGVVQDITEAKAAELRQRATSVQLAHKTEQLQVTLDSITQGIVSVDAEGQVQVSSRRVLELLDLPDTVLRTGAAYDDVVRFQVQRGDFGPDVTYIDAQGRRQQFDGGPSDAPEVYVRRNRTGALVEIRTRLLPGGGFVRTYADVTAYVEAQRALRDSEAELRALLDAFPGFIAVGDASFTYTYVNERFALLVGRAREDIIGRPVREISGDARFAVFQQYAARVRAGEQLTVETDYPCAGGGPPVWLQVTHAMGGDASAGRQAYYALGIDISARKAAEAALIAARDEAERANRAKSAFLSSMSHELRTPMNAILGFGQLLISDPNHLLVASQREHVDEILRGARHLLELINEVLDLAQVETGKLQVLLEPVPLAALLEECVGLLQPLAGTDAVGVTLADAAANAGWIAADRTRVKQVLLNLLSNAIKYNRPGGEVRIACVDEDASVRIDITDTGPGLSAAQGARLFNAFERLDAVRTGVEGAGLGMALSKHLMAAMGGEIGLTSEVGRGSTFWIRLPRSTAPSLARADDAAPVARDDAAGLGATPRKVLYIEDNPVNVLVMEAMLARMPGLHLLTAALPESGLQMALDEQPDLILLDIQLPGIDGYEVLRRLRLGAATRTTPVIAVSASAMPDDVALGLSAGFARYLTKPVDLRQLLAAVAEVLARE
jgi:PAS domain S-box-containing protein